MTIPKDVTKSYLEQLPEWTQPKCFIIDLKFHIKHRPYNIDFFIRKRKKQTNKKENKQKHQTELHLHKQRIFLWRECKLSLEGIPIRMS